MAAWWGWWCPRVSLGTGSHQALSAYIYPPDPLAHSFIHPSLFLFSSWHGYLIRNYASELEETPRAGCRRAAGFLVQIHLLPLPCWTEARTTSIHRTCVIPRRHRSCGAGLLRPYDYTTLRLASSVFIDNVHAGTFMRTWSSRVWLLSLLCYLTTV
jgi:hypothetical protein